VSQLTEKILRSGLIDKHTTALMEKYGLLEAGSTEKVNEDALKGATKEQLEKLAEGLAVEAEREFALKETMLDLNQLKWPTTVRVIDDQGIKSAPIESLIDRMGRFYFREQDVNIKWFVPGYGIERVGMVPQTIIEVTELFVGDQVAAIQVAVSG
jgi:methylase of polypeptide subunit release factors